MSSWNRLETMARKLEVTPWLVVGFLTVFYILAILIPANLILWHDELYTFYIARSGSWHEFIESIRQLDLNPPLIYLLTGLSQRVFGNAPYATRLPEIVAFYLMSMGCLYFVARRSGWLWGAFTVLLIWYGPCLYFATQARPYALLMAFFTLTLLSWDRAVQSNSSRRLALAGVAIGCTGMMMSHVFGIFSIGPFILAEMVRWYRSRHADWALWACVLLPLGLVGTYVPLMNQFDVVAFPTQYQAGPRKVVSYFYKWAYLNICPGLLAALLAALASSRGVKEAEGGRSAFSSAHIALFVGFLLPPLLINAVLMRTHGAFWDRYCITSGVAIYVALGLFLSYKFGASRFTALTSTVVIGGLLVGSNIIAPYMDQQARKRVVPKINFATFRSDLPFVAASGLTFVEMDHNESEKFKGRLYYLTDRESALKYAHATLFEGLPKVAQHFPIRGHVEPYHQFLREHHRFLVIGNNEYPEDWLMKKLRDDGAELTFLGDFFTPYKDAAVYEVRMPNS